MKKLRKFQNMKKPKTKKKWGGGQARNSDFRNLAEVVDFFFFFFCHKQK